MADKMSAAEYQRMIQAKPKAKRKATPSIQLGSGSKGGVTELIFWGKVPGMNGRGGLLRMHWRTKVRLRNRYQLIAMAHSWAAHSGPVRLELVRHSTGTAMDHDNLVSTGKLLIDAIVRAGILPDDKDVIIQERSYTQTRAINPASQFTLIRIVDL